MTHNETPFAVLLVLIFGFFGLLLVFSDLAPNETWQIRIFICAAYFFLCGLGFGFAFPNIWPLVALSALGGLLLGGLLILAALGKYGGTAFDAQEPPYISSGLLLLFGPLGLALIGGYVGKTLSRFRRGTRDLMN